MYTYHPQKSRKLPDDITSHTQVDMVTTFIPAHAQLTEAAAILTTKPLTTTPKAAAHGKVLTSAKKF